MHGTFYKRIQDTGDKHLSWNIALAALPILIAIVLIGMAASYPSAGKWIADAAQAEYVGTEYVGTDIMPNLPPTRIARPDDGTQVGKAL